MITIHKILLIVSVPVFLILVLASCSTTRKLDDGEILYLGHKNPKIETAENGRLPENMVSDIKAAVDVPANKKWLYFFPVGLWTYNNMDNHDKGFKRWFYDKFAQEPIVVSDVRPEVRTKMIEDILDNNGYFQGTSTYELISKKNKRKAKIKYNVVTGDPYLIDSVQLLPDTCHLYHLIDSIALSNKYLKDGSRYCTDSLSVLRTKIANQLRNRGYYFFQPQFIVYEADSLINKGRIALRLNLSDDIPKFALSRYRTGDITVKVERNEGGGVPDTITYRRGTLIQMTPSRLRKEAIPECVTFRKGSIFSVNDLNRTQQYLSQLGIFSTIDIETVPDTTAVDPTLNVDINCRLDIPLEVTVEANVSSKSNSYLGPGLSLGFTNKNLFGGGEQFSANLFGSYEWQTGRGHNSLFNSYEFGLTTSLSFPRLIAPRFVPRRRHASNWTRITLNADLLNRPHYFKIAQFNVSYGYDWMSSRFVNNSLTLFKLTYTKLLNTTESFDAMMAENPAVALSFMDQFIPQMSYTYSYDRTFRGVDTFRYYIKAIESGNIFWGIGELCGDHNQKELFGTPFSQFVKGEAQFVYGRRFDNHSLWTRVQCGAAHAYGNSDQIPYNEQFYCGGANSVRAFAVRSIGPGSYHAPADMANGYFDQTGTFIFQFNLEYRFPIYGPLQGALFFDSGNIWLLSEDPARPGGKLKASNFLKELATGTGLGLRFDISMLVVRADLGVGIHAPYNTSKRGYYNMENFGKSLAFHLAIGYPF